MTMTEDADCGRWSEGIKVATKRGEKLTEDGLDVFIFESATND
jgi:hypothetical protein